MACFFALIWRSDDGFVGLNPVFLQKKVQKNHNPATSLVKKRREFNKMLIFFNFFLEFLGISITFVSQ